MGRSSLSGTGRGESAIKSPMSNSRESIRLSCWSGVLQGPHSIMSLTTRGGIRASSSAAVRIGTGRLLARKCQPQ